VTDGGLKGEWADEYEHWKARFDPVFDEIASVEMSVISWGPGEGSRYYKKRAQLNDHMRSIPNTWVATPEELTRTDDRFRGIEVWDAEEIQALVGADLVVCLEVDDPIVSGAPTEVTALGRIPKVRDILRLLLPKRPKHGPRPLILEAGRLLPEALKFAYTPKQYEDCQDMRAKCEEWLSAGRIKMYLAKRRSA
jgi:hypothetical protein